MVTARRRILIVFASLLLGVMGWYWSQPPRKPTFAERMTTPIPGVNRSLIQSLDLRIGDQRFGDSALVVTQNDRLPIRGKVTIHFDKIEMPHHAQAECRFSLKCAPVGSPEEIWKKLGGKSGTMLSSFDDPQFIKQVQSALRVKPPAPINLNVPRPVIIESVWTIKPEKYPPGEYDTRLYLSVNVRNTEIQYVHHIGSGRLTVLAPSEKHPGSSSRSQ